MKNNDIALIIVIAFVSGMLSFGLSRFLFVKPEDKKVQVEVVEAIQPTFVQPDSKYFNSESEDPTQLIIIGNDANDAPFQGAR